MKQEPDSSAEKENLQSSDEIPAATTLDLQRAQEMLLQQEKLASIGQLAAGVAHEINNPIAYIQSNLQALQRYMTSLADLIRPLETASENAATEEILSIWSELKQKAADADLEFVLDDISQLLPQSLEGVSRIKTIVNDLKGFSRADEAKLESIELNECIDAALNIVWNELKYHVTLNKNYGKLPRIECYSQQLTQVFVNLLINAGQAIEENGEITITTAVEGDQVVLRFADTGSGIPADKLSKIFDPFFTTKAVGKGTGLGLSIVYEIIKRHGGKIEATSTVGEGTEFRIALPVTCMQDE